MEDQKYLSIVTISRKKINIVKIRTNSHELHSEIGHWSIPKTPWEERDFHLCESMSVEDENHFLLYFLRSDRPKLVSMDVNHHHHHHHIELYIFKHDMIIKGKQVLSKTINH